MKTIALLVVGAFLPFGLTSHGESAITTLAAVDQQVLQSDREFLGTINGSAAPASAPVAAVRVAPQPVTTPSFPSAPAADLPPEPIAERTQPAPASRPRSAEVARKDTTAAPRSASVALKPEAKTPRTAPKAKAASKVRIEPPVEPRYVVRNRVLRAEPVLDGGYVVRHGYIRDTEETDRRQRDEQERSEDAREAAEDAADRAEEEAESAAFRRSVRSFFHR